jgi:DNA-directed RNA polymerase specialized sigma24 family protein
LTHGEVATRLGISQSTVVKHMIKAVEYCKRRVQEQGS